MARYQHIKAFGMGSSFGLVSFNFFNYFIFVKTFQAGDG